MKRLFNVFHSIRRVYLVYFLDYDFKTTNNFENFQKYSLYATRHFVEVLERTPCCGGLGNILSFSCYACHHFDNVFLKPRFFRSYDILFTSLWFNHLKNSCCGLGHNFYNLWPIGDPFCLETCHNIADYPPRHHE